MTHVLLVIVSLLAFCAFSALAADEPADALKLTLRSLAETAKGRGQYQVAQQDARWDPRKTAAIVCDMWDKHWCAGATGRVGEMAPRMNDLLKALRLRGVLIIHSPSDTMKFYEQHPGRKLALSAPAVEPRVPLKGWCHLDKAREGALPIDDSDGGCDCQPMCKTGRAWQKQIAALEIAGGDAIADNREAYYLLRQRNVENVLIMGVHENMCVLGRPFGIRQLVTQGLNVALVRDLTDTMYNPRAKPFVDHFTGTDLVTWHIEKHWCPTVTSDQVLGGQPFRFAADRREPLQFRNDLRFPDAERKEK
jgi:nicotinamidase-related amidase